MKKLQIKDDEEKILTLKKNQLRKVDKSWFEYEITVGDNVSIPEELHGYCFYLNTDLAWELVEDDDGDPVLIPYEKPSNV